jgi:hypothetical protein
MQPGLLQTPRQACAGQLLLLLLSMHVLGVLSLLLLLLLPTA